MNKKYVQISSINQRIFVEELLRVGSLGGVLSDVHPVRKAVVLAAVLEVAEDVDVGENAFVKVFYKENDKQEKKEEAPVAKEKPEAPAEEQKVAKESAKKPTTKKKATSK